MNGIDPDMQIGMRSEWGERTGVDIAFDGTVHYARDFAEYARSKNLAAGLRNPLI